MVLGDWDDTQIDGTDWLYSEDGTHVTTDCYYFIVNNTEQKICTLNNRTYYNNNQSHYFTGNNFTSWALIYALQGYLNASPTEPYMIATKEYVDGHSGYAENTSNWNMTICIEGNCSDIYAGVTQGGSNDGWWPLAGCYLYNNSNSLDINETCLNATIDDRAGNTYTAGNYLYLDSYEFNINETQLNNTIDARDSDTTYNSDEIYIYENSNTFYMNETKLNSTITNLAGNSYTAGDYLYLDSYEFNLNETDLNNTILSYDEWNQSGTDVFTANTNSDVGIGTTNPTYELDIQRAAGVQSIARIYGDGPNIILQSATTDHASRPGITIWDNSVFNFQGDDHADQEFDFFSKIAATRTYDAIFKTFGSGTGWTQYLSFKHDGTKAIINANEGNITMLTDNALALTLSTDKNLHIINNITMNGGDLVCTGSNGECSGTSYTAGNYLYLNGNEFNLNETQLNTTIDARDTDTTYNSDEIYIYESANVFYLNETKLNATIEALDDDTYHTHDQNLNTTNDVSFSSLNVDNNMTINGTINSEIGVGEYGLLMMAADGDYLGLRYNADNTLRIMSNKDLQFNADIFKFQTEAGGNGEITDIDTISSDGNIEIDATSQILIPDPINHTATTSYRYFANGCYEQANTTGVYIIC